MLLAVDAADGGFRFPLEVDSILRVLGLAMGFLLAFFRITSSISMDHEPLLYIA